MIVEKEIRSTAGIKLDGNTVSGLAIPYNSPSKPLPFIETILNGAASEFLRSKPTIRALMEHSPSLILAKYPTNLTLTESDAGVSYSFKLPDTTAGRDCRSLLENGTIQGASFWLSVPKGGDSWTRKDNVNHRSISKMAFPEISLVSDPCYTDTTASLRSFNEFQSLLNTNVDNDTLRRIVASWGF
jgi:HK97 family phage prohead protease